MKRICNRLLILLFLMIIFGFSTCKKSKISPNCWGKCEEAMLYYTPKCATIEGSVRILATNEWFVFDQNVPKKFRQDSVLLCIRYKNLGSKILTADCRMAEMIKIKCFLER